MKSIIKLVNKSQSGGKKFRALWDLYLTGLI